LINSVGNTLWKQPALESDGSTGSETAMKARDEGVQVGPASGRKESMGGTEAQELWRRQERNL